MSVGPYSKALSDAVAAAYDVFGRGRVSGGLEVCLCPVCMTEATRAQIVATPNDALSVALIQEYSNSAHGVPENLDDLRLLLPRYLEIMAQDELVDHVGVGTELLRFGHALKSHPELYCPAQREVLDVWARAMIWHYAWADTTEEGALYTPSSLFELLLCGGWRVEVLTETLESVFDAPEIGHYGLRAFVEAVVHRAITRHGRIAPDWFALRYCSEEVRADVAAWLNALAASERVLDVASDPDGADPFNSVQAFAYAAGEFDASLFPGRD